jgi:hypothetical protein
MATFYRIDEWFSDETGSKTFFEESKEEALKYVSGFRQITAKEAEGIEYTSIQAFEADTCDWEGFVASNSCDEQEPINYARI